MSYITSTEELFDIDIEHEDRLLSYLLGLTLDLDYDDLRGVNAFRAARVLREYDPDLQGLRRSDENIDVLVTDVEKTLAETIPQAQEPKMFYASGPDIDAFVAGYPDRFMQVNIEYIGSLGGGTPSNPLKVGQLIS